MFNKQTNAISIYAGNSISFNVVKKDIETGDTIPWQSTDTATIIITKAENTDAVYSETYDVVTDKITVYIPPSVTSTLALLPGKEEVYKYYTYWANDTNSVNEALLTNGSELPTLTVIGMSKGV